MWRGLQIRLVVAAGLVSGVCNAQGTSLKAFKVHELTENVYWIEGGGGNSGVLVGDNGVIVIDAKTTSDDGKQLLGLIARITSKPVTTVILTHSDDDHVGGLVAFPKGTPIIAHVNNQAELEADPTNHGHGFLPAEEFPNLVMTRSRELLQIDGINLQLLHWAPAHTSGDLVVYLPDLKIVFTGDIIGSNAARPGIHHGNKNGSAEGWIVSAKGIAALDADRFVPGHGNVIDANAVQKKMNDAETERTNIAQMIKQGKSLDEIKVAIGDPPPGRNAAFSYSDAVYEELTHKAP
jgi:glyoxylase-like metal-dependent hydrolase (beta-lactamase superfamily II)